MKLAAIAATATTLMAASAFAGGLFGEDNCRYTAARRVAAPISGVTKVVIHAESGSLKVDGTQGVSQIVADGAACTSEEDFLSRMTLTTRRQGSELHIVADIPEKSVIFGFFQAQLDFAVTLPPGLPVTINDDSGWIKVSNTGPLTIDDDSGSIEARNIRGPVKISDDSGSIELDTIYGSVTIEDESGEIVVKNVQGGVEIEDDSGSITVAKIQGSLRIHEDDSGSITASNIQGDVVIDDDGSGGIQVADVGGRFHVGHKGSGGIDYDRVNGKVTIPERHRDRD
jgi:ribosomal protein S28E/S33